MMTSKRPYLLRAINEWIVDNGLTPHILVNALADGVQVPQQYVEDGKIVLNVSPNAVRELEISNELLSFNARFGGQFFNLHIPIKSVLAVYAKENGIGVIFPEVEQDPEAAGEEPLEKVPHLKLVK